ncbi:MAG TPA: hypothetical protein VK483_02200 [Chitinophagaceae bacterium]|nr:hypothetical protein [Chitinophagaceae bacterium]
MQYLPILVLALIVVLVSSYFISRSAYRKLVSSQNKYALAIAILIFLVSVVILGFLIIELVINNIRIER